MKTKTTSTDGAPGRRANPYRSLLSANSALSTVLSRSLLSRSLLGVGLLGVSLLGCKSESEESSTSSPSVSSGALSTNTVSSGAQSAAPPAAGAPGAGAASTSDTPPTDTSASSKRNIPALERSAVAQPRLMASKTLDNEGDTQAKAGHWQAAQTLYERALRSDPGNVSARYNLARTLAATDATRDAIDLLCELRRADCKLCAERLGAALAEPAFRPIAGDVKFVECTKGAGDKLPTVRLAAETMNEWFLRSDRKTLAPHDLLDSRSLIVLENRAKGAKVRYEQLHGSAAFRERLPELFPNGVYPGGTPTCANGCCTAGGVMISGVHVVSMCFKTSGAAAVHLRKLVVEGDPESSFPG